MADFELFLHDLEMIRSSGPLVLNITNVVVANITANALLALGGSPLMSHAEEEAAELTGISHALVVNIGTLNQPDIRAMHTAWAYAANRGIPVVFDPVGAGASALRTATSLSLLDAHRPAIIRGNGSEVLTLAGESGEAKGVDSTRSADAARNGALALARERGCVVCVSGESDMVTDGVRECRVFGGHVLMPRVTGLGCTATIVCAAFAAVNPDPFEATIHGMACMAMAGSIAGARAAGPGTMQLHFLDALHGLDADSAQRLFRIEMM
ncbi:hydroxyethylthiazole kinase [Pseudodesulfovibrio sp. F-1]|uniref:Hydroxyethylthiazole kinase n=1 Tax=Pseudodesulfovibrio alkaliphilus TaxID=2661613 RepID=A0A7K1KRP5_9BACT|nr:hydroxyethylthiazole kinase [Pseudodesulfovibrio alkaliphilus]MUM78744.1 hydroxyethylthiazole kinase [Pseudodesulfovibrio alkaliphilus]